jgi:hypothetical protein
VRPLTSFGSEAPIARAGRCRRSSSRREVLIRDTPADEVSTGPLRSTCGHHCAMAVYSSRMRSRVRSTSLRPMYSAITLVADVRNGRLRSARLRSRGYVSKSAAGNGERAALRRGAAIVQFFRTANADRARSAEVVADVRCAPLGCLRQAPSEDYPPFDSRQRSTTSFEIRPRGATLMRWDLAQDRTSARS